MEKKQEMINKYPELCKYIEQATQTDRIGREEIMCRIAAMGNYDYDPVIFWIETLT